MKMKIKVDSTEFELEFTDYKEACTFLQEFINNNTNKLNKIDFEEDKQEDDGR